MGIIKRLEELMEKEKITKPELVKKTGLKRSTVYRLFEDDVNEEKISLETLRPIANVFDVSLDFLINGIQNDENILEDIPEDIQGMFRQIKSFSEEDRKALARIIGKMSKHLNE